MTRVGDAIRRIDVRQRPGTINMPLRAAIRAELEQLICESPKVDQVHVWRDDGSGGKVCNYCGEVRGDQRVPLADDNVIIEPRDTQASDTTRVRPPARFGKTDQLTLGKDGSVLFDCAPLNPGDRVYVAAKLVWEEPVRVGPTP